MVKSGWFSTLQTFAYLLMILWAIWSVIDDKQDSAMLALLWALVIKTDMLNFKTKNDD